MLKVQILYTDPARQAHEADTVTVGCVAFHGTNSGHVNGGLRFGVDLTVVIGHFDIATIRDSREPGRVTLDIHSRADGHPCGCAETWGGCPWAGRSADFGYAVASDVIRC